MYTPIYMHTHNQSERIKNSLRKLVLGSFKFNGSITHFLTPSPQDQVKNLLLFSLQFSSSYSPTLLGYMDSASVTGLLQHLQARICIWPDLTNNLLHFPFSALHGFQRVLACLPCHPTPVLLPGNSHGWRSLVGCSPWGCEESDMTEQLHFHFSLSCIGEGNGNPLQCSCLENPRDGRARWAAVCGVAQSRTRLK